MKAWHVIVPVALGGLVLGAVLISRPSRGFRMQILQGPPGFTWRVVEPDGTEIARSSSFYPTEADARAAAAREFSP